MGSKLATCGLAVAAAALALIPATAVAGKAPLELEHGGTPVATGSPGSVGLLLAECGIFFNGKVTSNNAATDVITTTSSSNPECNEPTETISGSITEAQLTAKRKAELKGTVHVRFATGPCEYTFTKWKASFSVPGFAFPEGAADGKLVKGTSAKTGCSKTLGGRFSFDATNEVFGEPFETAFGS